MRLPETYQQQQRLYQQAREQIKNLPGGHAFTDIQFGFKRTDQQLTPRLAIRFQVKKKKQPKELRRSEAVPKKWQGFETDVVDFRIKPQTRIVDPREEVRPLLGGLQVQSCLFQQRINWGTLGYCFRLQGQPAAISNYHVLFGQLSESDAARHINRLQLFQPNKPNYGRPIGLVTGLFHQDLDYAVVRVQTAYDELQSVNQLPGRIEGYQQPLLGARYIKVGAASGRSMGLLEARSLENPSRIVLGYQADPQNDSPKISLPGDSGSVWLAPSLTTTNQWKLLALHYGGDPARNVAYATLFSSIFPSIRQQLNRFI